MIHHSIISKGKYVAHIQGKKSVEILFFTYMDVIVCAFSLNSEFLIKSVHSCWNNSSKSTVFYQQTALKDVNHSGSGETSREIRNSCAEGRCGLKEGADTCFLTHVGSQWDGWEGERQNQARLNYFIQFCHYFRSPTWWLGTKGWCSSLLQKFTNENKTIN